MIIYTICTPGSESILKGLVMIQAHLYLQTFGDTNTPVCMSSCLFCRRLYNLQSHSSFPTAI